MPGADPVHFYSGLHGNGPGVYRVFTGPAAELSRIVVSDPRCARAAPAAAVKRSPDVCGLVT